MLTSGLQITSGISCATYLGPVFIWFKRFIPFKLEPLQPWQAARDKGEGHDAGSGRLRVRAIEAHVYLPDSCQLDGCESDQLIKPGMVKQRVQDLWHRLESFGLSTPPRLAHTRACQQIPGVA